MNIAGHHTNEHDIGGRMTSIPFSVIERFFSKANRGRKLALIPALALLVLGAGASVNLAAGSAPVGTAVPLALGGKAQAVIVLGPAAGEGAKFAAAELQKDLKALTGADFQIATEADTAAPALILIGGPDENPLVKRAAGAAVARFEGLKPDGFVLKTSRLDKRPVVVAGGNNDGATMYAVFELLQRLGVTFRLTGDILPEARPSLEAPALNLRIEPAIEQRGFLVEAHRGSIAMLSYNDWSKIFDQMAKMKYNHLEYWWFGHQPDVQYSYHGEPKLIGDISTKESGYINTMYEDFGSRTTDDIAIGKHWFPGHRLAPTELQEVETPEQAFAAVQDLQRRMMKYAKTRHVKMWLVDELGVIAPNLARYTRVIGPTPFEGVFGSFVDPLDPVNQEIQANRLKAYIDTYPDAAGILLNIPEVYYPLRDPKDMEFFAQPAQQALFQQLRALMMPWDTRWLASRDEMVNSTLGYFDLFKSLLAKRDEVAPHTKLGLATVGRGYVLPQFDKMLPKDIPFATFDTGGPCGYGTGLGMPMNYFGGMGERVRIDSPYLDDDCDIVSQQFNVWVYTDKDRIYTDGVKNGLTGVAPWMAQPRGTEANSTFLAEADWNPQLTREEFYHDYSARLFGAAAAPDMYNAFMTLEAKKAYGTLGTVEDYPTTMQCCGPLPAVRLAHEYSLQEDAVDGPSGADWTQFIAAAPVDIGIFEHSIAMVEQALASLHAAEPKVAPQGKHELAYLISRTESNRDAMHAQVTERQAYLAFDRAFQERASVPHEQFVADLEASLKLFDAAHQQAETATTEYAQIIDHTSDLETLYHLNVSILMGLDLVRQWMQTIVEFHEGKLYTRHVPFEKLFTREVRVKGE
jgi:hypothetical protein